MSGILSVFGNLFSAEGRVSAEELKQMIGGKEALSLIDVRSSGEFKSGHIPGSVSIPLNSMEGLKSFPYKGRIVLYCAGGVRSRTARNILLSRGIEDVVDLKGGITAWVKAGGEIRK